MEVSELNELLSMIQLQLPDDMRELGLNYYGYGADDKVWVELDPNDPNAGSYKQTVSSMTDLYNSKVCQLEMFTELDLEVHISTMNIKKWWRSNLCKIRRRSN